MIDIADRLTATYREVRATGRLPTPDADNTDDPAPEEDSGSGLVLRRRLDHDLDTVWAAVTDADTLGRWLAPVTGALRAGGAFSVAGHADGIVLDCTPPHRLAVTWGAESAVVTVRLAADDGGHAVLELVHTGLPLDGPVRHGPWWDVAILGLELALSGAATDDLTAWRARPDVQTFAQHAVSAWVRATDTAGTATPDELSEAAHDCLSSLAPDLTRGATD